MGNTLVDEPVPPTQSQPPTGDRPTLDDVPAAPRAPAAPPRGASPTLIDAPAAAPAPGAPAPRRGASPTLADAVPPHAARTSPGAPLYAVPSPPAYPAPTPPAAPVRAAVAPVPAAPLAAPAKIQDAAKAPPMVQMLPPLQGLPPAQPLPAPQPSPPQQASPQQASLQQPGPQQPGLQQASPQQPSPQQPSPQQPSPQQPSPQQASLQQPSLQQPSPQQQAAAHVPQRTPLLAGAAASPPSEPRPPQAAPLPAAPLQATPLQATPPLAGPSPAAPPPAAPSSEQASSPNSPLAHGAPPPLAYPAKPPPSPGILAQLPAMPGPRAALPPHLVATPVPDTNPSPAPEHPASEEAPAREAMLPDGAARPPAPETASLEQPPSPAAAPGAPPAPGAPGAMPMRLAPGARTLVGVAPGSPPLAGTPGDLGARNAENNHSPNNHSPNNHSPNNTPPPAGADAADPGAAEAHERAGEMRPTVTDTPKKSGARKWIAAVFAVLGVLAIAAVVIGYFVFVRYIPLADRHIPAASNVAIRADARQIGTFAPVRKHLWPALVDKPSQKPGKTFADRVAENTGINPTLDIREIIVASMDAKSWVLLVGGSFKPGKFVPGMEKVMQEEGHPDWHRSGDLLVGPTGLALGQAEDGTLILGTEAEIVTAALPATDENKRMDLPRDGAISFALSKEAFEEMSRETGMFDPSGALRRIRHMRGTLSLGDDPGVDIDIEPKGGENADALGKDMDSFLAKLRLGLVLFPDRFGEKTAISSAKVAVENEHVRVRGSWPLDGLDRGCEKLVGLLFASGPTTPPPAATK